MHHCITGQPILNPLYLVPTSILLMVCSHITDLSNVLLSCLPGFWSVASSSRLADAPDLPPAMRSRLKQSIKAVATTAQRLVSLRLAQITRATSSPLKNMTSFCLPLVVWCRT